MTLNPFRRNALEIGLGHLERVLVRLRREAHAPAWNGPTLQTAPLPVWEQERLESLGAAILEEIGSVARESDLQAEPADLDPEIDGKLTAAWVYLKELLARKRNKYGDVDPGLAQRLDPHIQRLIRLTREVVRARGDTDKERT